MKSSRIMLTAALAVLLCGSASAGTMTWIGGSDTWDDTNATPWSGDVPVAGDTVQLTQDDVGPLVIDFAAGSLDPGQYGDLTIRNTLGTTTLQVGAGDDLRAMHTYINRGAVLDQSGGNIWTVYDLNVNAGQYNISDGTGDYRNVYVNGSGSTAALELSGTGLIKTRGGGYSGLGGGLSTATMTVIGGEYSGPDNFNVKTNGTLDVQDGTFGPGHVSVSGGAIQQTGGLIRPAYDLNFNHGSYTLSAGEGNYRNLHVNGSGGEANLDLSADGLLDWSRGNAGNVGGGDSTATLTQTGGTHNGGGLLAIRTNGVYDMQDGTASTANLRVGEGNVTQTGGTITVSYEIVVGSIADETGTHDMSDGDLSGRSLMLGGGYEGSGDPWAGGAGVFTHTGGNVDITGAGGTNTWIGLWVCHQDATLPSTFTWKGGTLSGTFSVNVQSMGTVEGYGTVPNGNFMSLTNSGRIIADGEGEERDLDLSAYTGSNTGLDGGKFDVKNPVDNTSDKGWFAVNKGRLLLPNIGSRIDSPAGSGFGFGVDADHGSIYNWGEDQDDSDIDLVNSAQFDFIGLGPMTDPNVNTARLTGALLATDHIDVPTAPMELISVHDFSLTGNTFSDFDLTIRYDEAAAAAKEIQEARLTLYQWNGASWDDLLAIVDTAAKNIRATEIYSMGLFAVGEPPPSSLEGDVNGDCTVNILDLIGIRNHLNQDPTTPPENEVYDVNYDGSINILDMIFVRNRLNTSCPEE